MKPFFTQAPGQQRQIFFTGLIHQQVDGVVYSNACYIGTADGAPHPVVEFGPVFKLTRHPQQQMVRHFFFLQGTGCSQLLRKHSRTQQAGTGQIPVFPHGALVLKSAHQCCFHQSAEDAEQILIIQVHLLFTGRAQADEHHKTAVLPHTCGVHRPPGEEAAVHPQALLLNSTNHIQPLLHLQRVRRLRHHPGTGSGKAGKDMILFHAVDGETVIFQHILHDLHRLAVDLLRLQHIQLLGHSIDLAKAVPAAKDLAAEHLFILQRILIQFPGKFKPLTQQLVFFLHETGGLCITQLHIPAGRSHYKIYNERQPVGRRIKQQHQGSALPQIAHCQRNRCQHSRQHTCIEAVDCADQHDEHKPEIDHLELRVRACNTHQQLRDQPRGSDLYQPQQTRALADLIHRFACKAFFLCLLGTPHIIDRGQIIQNAVPLEPAVPAADSIIRCGIGLDGIGAVQHLQPGLQLLQHLAQLLLRIPKNIRQRKSLRLRRPCIEHPGNEISQFFCTERKQRLRGLFIHLNCTGRYLLEQPCKLLRTAGRDGIQIG